MIKLGSIEFYDVPLSLSTESLTKSLSLLNDFMIAPLAQQAESSTREKLLLLRIPGVYMHRSTRVPLCIRRKQRQPLDAIVRLLTWYFYKTLSLWHVVSFPQLFLVRSEQDADWSELIVEAPELVFSMAFHVLWSGRTTPTSAVTHTFNSVVSKSSTCRARNARTWWRNSSRRNPRYVQTAFNCVSLLTFCHQTWYVGAPGHTWWIWTPKMILITFVGSRILAKRPWSIPNSQSERGWGLGL